MPWLIHAWWFICRIFMCTLRIEIAGNNLQNFWQTFQFIFVPSLYFQAVFGLIHTFSQGDDEILSNYVYAIFVYFTP